MLPVTHIVLKRRPHWATDKMKPQLIITIYTGRSGVYVWTTLGTLK